MVDKLQIIAIIRAINQQVQVNIMPMYEFKCQEGTVTEKFVKMGTKEIKCPKCHGKAKKIISSCTFKLKGGGWYADGYTKKG
jgi:putative FmdB family regulatory protein